MLAWNDARQFIRDYLLFCNLGPDTEIHLDSAAHDLLDACEKFACSPNELPGDVFMKIIIDNAQD